MKRLMIAAVLAAQLVAAAQPAFAAELTDTTTRQVGAFGGMRVRVPLDGRAGEQRIRAGLTLSPTMHSRDLRGHSQLRIGEGLELGVNGGDRVVLSLAGTPVSRLAQGPAGPDGGRAAGVSTVGWIAIGAGVLVLAVGGFYWWLVEEAGDCDPGEC